MSDLSQVTVGGDGEEVVVAHLAGEIDLSNAATVGEQLASAVPNRALGLVVDMSATTYLDSSGVSLMFDLSERLRRRQQQLRLVVPEDAPLRRVLRIVAAGDALPVAVTVDEASEQIRAAA
jgi:anti-sigma B factor antagonist